LKTPRARQRLFRIHPQMPLARFAYLALVEGVKGWFYCLKSPRATSLRPIPNGA